MYADDTIALSTDTKIMNEYLKRIEEIGQQYGPKPNKDKCETMYPMKKQQSNLQTEH